MRNKKRYYIPGIDEFTQMVETPASKARTDSRRFLVNTIISSVAAVAAIIAAVVAIMAYISR